MLSDVTVEWLLVAPDACGGSVVFGGALIRMAWSLRVAELNGELSETLLPVLEDLVHCFRGLTLLTVAWRICKSQMSKPSKNPIFH